ncbi:MAG: acyloxyacyl hydrolase [Bacteroidales bacterium]|nr:acyloxyacyl hydrolase [Bacteroidales bacterium]
MKKQILFVALLMLSSLLFAQQWGLSATGGYTLPNKSEWDYIGGPNYGVDVSVRWRTSGEETWQRLWRRPSFGLRANFAYIPDGIAGNRIGIAGFMTNPLWNDHGKGSLAWELDFGLSGYTLPYRVSHNEQNYFIGSYLNCLIHAGLEYKQPFRDGSAIVLAAKLVHSSNGYILKPNQGLNFLQVDMGYLLPASSQMVVSPQPVVDLKPGHPLYLSLSYAGGLVQARYSGPAKNYYYCHTAEAALMWRAAERVALGGGVDYSYNYSQLELQRWWNDDYTYPFYLCYFGSIEPYWGNMSVRISAGGYLLKSQNPHVVSLPFFERVGLYYHFPKNIFGGVSLRAYAAHIDFIEFTLGYKIPLL